VSRREERDEVTDLGALGVGQPGEAGIRRFAEPECGELIRKSRAWDPPKRLEELDEGDPGRIGCAEEIGRRRSRPRRPGGIEERGNVSGIAPQRSAQGAHRETRVFEDIAKPGTEDIVGEHRSVLSSWLLEA
jgi:hypothetical protein